MSNCNCNRNIYFKILISIVILLWLIYFIQNYIDNYKKETFIPTLKEFYRPRIRNINQRYEQFMNNYGPSVIRTKLKKWNIY